MRFIFLLLILLITPLSQADGAWLSPSWNYKVKVEVNPNKVGTTTAVTSMPVYNDCGGLPTTFWTNASSTGADIRVVESDDSTETAFEMVSFSTTSKTCELHFMADSLGTTSTSTFYIYYGNATATAYAVGDTYGRNAVWTAYRAIYHMNTLVTDYSGNSKTFTDVNAVGQATQFLGTSADFTPNDTLEINNSFVNSFPVVITGWINPDIVNGDGNMWSMSDNNVHYYQLKVGRGSDSHIVYRSNNNTQAEDEDSTITAVIDSNYKITTVIHSSTTMSMYINGYKYLDTVTTYAATGLTWFEIGSLKRATRLQYSNSQMDEFRIKSSTDVASEWTEYNNQSATSTFFYIGAEEAYSAGTSTVASTTGSIIWFD